jgi:DNA-binding MarR family transcriptional regulator
MEHQGLVTRTRDPMRRREVHVGLTKQGRQALREAGRRNIINHTMSGLSEEVSRGMITQLEPLRDSLLTELGLAANRRISPELE